MSWSAEKTLCFLVVSLLFFQTKSQVLSNTRANEGTLKHLVHLKVFFRAFENEEEVSYDSIMASGSLIKPNWILTAAHNIEDHEETENGIKTEYYFHKVKVKAGTKDWKNYDKETTQKRTIRKENIIIHERRPIYFFL